MNFFKRWFRWDLRYYYWGKIKDFWTLKANKPDWHQITSTFEKYPYMSNYSIQRLYDNGNLVDEVKIPFDVKDYSFSLWFNHNTNLSFLGREQ